MSSRIFSKPVQIVALAALLASPTIQAATLYWDGNDITGNADGGVGTWDTTLTNWDSLLLSGSNATWNNATPDLAVFGGTAGTVTLGTGITVGGLQFNTTGYTVATGANTLTFSGTANITLSNIAAAAITGTVGGSGNVILSTTNPATAGTLTLNGTSSGGWSGTTAVYAGTTLALSATNQGLLNTSAITLNGGGITLINADNDTEKALDRVSDSAVITSNGGTITYTTTTAGSTRVFAETIGSVDLLTGQTNFVNTLDKTAGSQTLTLSGLTRTGATNTSAITFSNAGGLNTTTDRIAVTGAGTTTAGQIIGPWATVGTAVNAQTDYAVYNTNYVVAANIGATAENSASWTAGGGNVTLSGATTLTGTRTLNTLRYTGGAGALGLGASTFNLETYGILNGGSGTLTISTTGTGSLTTPTGGGYLYLTAGNNAITVSAPIKDNGGAVTLVKSGNGTLLLSSTTSNYSGGTVLNAGTIATTSDANFGSGGGITVNGLATWNADNSTATTLTYNRAFTINDGAVLSLASGNAGKTITGVLSGNGSLVNTSSTGFAFTNTGNTFTGTVTAGFGMTFASLGESSNPINIGSSFTWTGAARTFTQRPFTMNATGGTTIASNGSGAMTIQQNLAFSGAAGNRTLSLSGSYAGGANSFSGNITDWTGSVISLTKSAAASTWALSGTNTYSGATTITEDASGNSRTLIFQGIQALSPYTTLTTATAGANGGKLPGVFKILDDNGGASSGTISRSGVNLSLSTGNSASDAMTIFVGNNNTANGGTSAGASINNTIQLGNMTFTRTAGSGGVLAVTGANGYRLQIGNVNVTPTGQTGNWTAKLQGDSAALLVTGNVQQTAGATSANTTLQLDGTNTDNSISGNILDSADGSPRALSLSKSGAGAWTLSGNNSYTGTTTINAGILSINSIGNVGAGASAVGAPITLANGTIAIGSTTTTGTLAYTGSGHTTDRVINLAGTTGGATLDQSGTGLLKFTSAFTATGVGAKILTLQGSTSGTGEIAGAIVNSSGGATSLTKAGTGTWVLSASNTYTGTTTVKDGSLVLDAGDNRILATNSVVLGDTGTTGKLVLGGTTTSNQTLAALTTTGLGGSVVGGNGSNSTLTLNIATGTTNTYGGNLGGVGTNENNLTLTKSGGGILTLTGTTFTHSGGTNVNAGTLLLSGAANMPSTGTLQVNGGATFSLADGTALGTTTTGTLGLATGALLGFDWNAGNLDMLTSTNAATTTGNIGIILNNTSPTGVGGTLISSASGGLTTANGTQYFLANNTNFIATLTTTDTAVSIGAQTAVTALTAAYWKRNQVTGAPDTMAFSSGSNSNWSATVGGATTGVVPGGNAVNTVFINTGGNTVTLGANMNLGSITFNDSSAVTISGINNYITLNNTGSSAAASSAANAALNNFTTLSAIGVTSTANVNNTINANIILGASQTWNVATSKTLTVNGAVSGAFGLTKAGAGTLTLTGNNTFSGALTVSSGSLILNGGSINNSAISLAGAAMSIINGGTMITASGGANHPTYGFSANSSMTVTGGNGVTSTWNLSGGTLGGPNSTQNNVQMTIDGAGYAGSAVVTNVGMLLWGNTFTNSTLTLTNGGQMNVNGQIQMGNNYYSSAGFANISIGGGTATSTLTGNNQAFYIGEGVRAGANNNTVTVSSGGVLTNIGAMFVGDMAYNGAPGGIATANRLTVSGTGTASMASITVGNARQNSSNGSAANANALLVTGGGSLTTSSGTNSIGFASVATAIANTNTATVTGTGSTWNVGNQNLIIGNAVASATSNNNTLTVGVGGSVTNVAALTVGSATGTSTGNQLVVNGSLTATSVTIRSGNSLSGSGTINSSVTVNGTLAAGNSNIESLVSGNLTLAAAAILAYEMNNDAAAGVAGDLTAVAGNLSIANTTTILTLSELGTGSWTAGEKLTLVAYSGTWNNGLFSYSSSTLADDSTITFSGTQWTFNYNDTSAGSNYTGDLTGMTSYITMTAIPEPGVSLLSGVALLGLLLRRRRR